MSNEIVEKSVESQLTSDYAQLSQWIKDTAANTGNFLNEQTPLFIQEYMNWMFWSNLITSVFFTAILCASIIATICLFKSAIKNKENKDLGEGLIFSGCISSMVSGLLLVVFLLIVPDASFKCLKVKLAPRVLIIEKVGELIK